MAEPVGERVRRFYDEMPFNLHRDAARAAEQLRLDPLPGLFPDLAALLASGAVRTAIDAGCGAGWLSHCLAHHHGVTVIGLDFCATALGQAREVTALLGGDRVRFVEADLLAFVPERPVDLVVSLGVLHHTADAAAAFGRLERWVAPGGSVYLGLYHRWGRRPFLAHYRAIAESSGEAAAERAFRRADPDRADDALHQRSWFRDQVLHPHETHHTLREVVGWFRDAGMTLASTSINRFGAVDDLAVLFAAEPGYETLSERANQVEGRFFPGFFTALGRRPAG